MPPRPVQVRRTRIHPITPVLPACSTQRPPRLTRSPPSRTPRSRLLRFCQRNRRITKNLSVAEHRVKYMSAHLKAPTKQNNSIAKQVGASTRAPSRAHHSQRTGNRHQIASSKATRTESTPESVPERAVRASFEG